MEATIQLFLTTQIFWFSAPQDSDDSRSIPGTTSVTFFGSVTSNTKEGKRLFLEASKDGTIGSFFKLSQFYDTQSEPTFCGLCTLTMTLNSLGVKPNGKWEGQQGWHDWMLDDCVSLVKVEKEGITIDEFVDIAKCAGTLCKCFRTSESSIMEFRKLVEKNCSGSNGNYVIVSSYSRPSLRQTGSGHFTTIGGYHKESDMVLILDVARYKYPPHWVPLKLLWGGMTVIDETTGLNRGFLPNSQAIQFASQEGKHLFLEALEEKTMEVFFPLISNFQTQVDPTNDGLATLSMLLNALQIDPQRKWKGIWRWFDEDMLKQFIQLAGIKVEGISLIQIAKLFKDKGIKVEIFESNNIEDFRKVIIDCCSLDNRFVIASRSEKIKSSHWLVMGGYHKKSDMILILDVARHQYPPYWIPLTSLWDTMYPSALHGSSKCEASTHQGGYIIISKLQGHDEPLN